MAWQEHRERHTTEYTKQREELPDWERELAQKNEAFAAWASSTRHRQRRPNRGVELRKKIGQLQLKVQNQRALQGLFEDVDARVNALAAGTRQRVAELRAGDPVHAARVESELAKIREKIEGERPTTP